MSTLRKISIQLKNKIIFIAAAALLVEVTAVSRVEAQTPAGQNCLCQTGNLAYGGVTGTAPQTYKPQ